MGTYRYEFEELRVVPGVDVLAFGYADLEYEVEPSDAYTGYRGGVSFGVDSITLYGSSTKSGDFDVPKDHPLFDLICKAIQAEDYRIGQAIEDEINDDMRDY